MLISLLHSQIILVNITDMLIEDEDSISLIDTDTEDLLAESQDQSDLSLAYSRTNTAILKFESDYDTELNGFQFFVKFIGKLNSEVW